MSILEAVAPDVWSITRDLRFWGIETGTRTTVVRLPGNRVFVHSPGVHSDELRVELDALGRVAVIVAPSLFHHLHVLEWQRAYPGARLCCCPALQRKREDVRFDCILGDTPEPEWDGTLRQVYFSARTMEDEVVFFHPPSGTMICCDAVFNLRHHQSRLTRLVAFALLNREPGATWLEHLMIRDRKLAREQVDRMLLWEIERIVLSHGDLVMRNGREVLRRAYAWL